MLEKLREYSSIVRTRRQELGLTCAELCVRASTSTKTLSLIENEQWPKNGQLSDHQKRGQGKCIVGLSLVLGFDSEKWIEELGLKRHKKSYDNHVLLTEEILKYLLQVVELTGPIRYSTAMDILSQRKL